MYCCIHSHCTKRVDVYQDMNVEAIIESVVKYGADQWYCLERKLGYNHAQVQACTHAIGRSEAIKALCSHQSKAYGSL